MADEILKTSTALAVALEQPQMQEEIAKIDCPLCGKRAAKYPSEARIFCRFCGNLRILNR